MGLKEIKDQVERDHPDWDGGQKLAEIRRLRKAEKTQRDADKPSEKTTEDTDKKPAPASIGEAWAFLAAIAVGMRLIGWAIWGDPFDEPHWYDALHAGLVIVGISAVVGAYRRRTTGQ